MPCPYYWICKCQLSGNNIYFVVLPNKGWSCCVCHFRTSFICTSCLSANQTTTLEVNPKWSLSQPYTPCYSIHTAKQGLEFKDKTFIKTAIKDKLLKIISKLPKLLKIAMFTWIPTGQDYYKIDGKAISDDNCGWDIVDRLSCVKLKICGHKTLKFPDGLISDTSCVGVMMTCRVRATVL